ncbi:MAG: hypothetical protein QXO24_03280 [Candidatus Micrarchaeaceae archaeon]
MKDDEIKLLAYDVAELIDESIRLAVDNSVISEEQGMALYQIFIYTTLKNKKTIK